MTAIERLQSMSEMERLIIAHDPFIGVNGQGVIYAETPVHSLLRMPVPTVLEKSFRDALGILLVHSATHDGTPYGAACALTLTNAAKYLQKVWRFEA